MHLEPIADGRFPVSAIAEGSSCQVLDLLVNLVGSRYPPAIELFELLRYDVPVKGPRYYSQFVHELRENLFELRVPDRQSDAFVAVVWFMDFPSVICTRAYLSDGDEPSHPDVSVSESLKARYLWMTGSMGSQYEH